MCYKMLEMWKGYNIRTKSVILYTRTSILNKEVVATKNLIDILPILRGKGGLTFVSSAPTRASKNCRAGKAALDVDSCEGLEMRTRQKLIQQNIRLKAESSRRTCIFLSGLQVFRMSSDIIPKSFCFFFPKRRRRFVW